ncbi:MAG TPA: hypothetical protein VJ846_03830 [Sphingomicrobium sp.]|nr:hypothetical protein [Sphingomicrobium sp.]
MLATRSAISLFLGIALVAGLGTCVGRHVGQSDGIASRQRLEIVWPNFTQMREQDRALLAGLALSCRLQDRSEDPASVLGCLKQAVEEDDVHLPYSMDRRQARVRLSQLIPTASVQ